MKTKLFTFTGFFAFLIFLAPAFCKSQTWGTPTYLIEPLSGTEGDVGAYPSLKVVNGNPAMAYLDNTHNRLMFVRATNVSGTSWGTPITVDFNSSFYGYMSLTIVNGNPAIAYYEYKSSSYRLTFVRALDVDGTSWGTPVTIDATSGDVGKYACLSIVNLNPAISYYDAINGDLKYVRATDVSGTTWGTPVSVQTTGDIGQYTSMQVANGNPAISYYDVTNANLKYIRATDASGTTWGTAISVDASGDVGKYTSLQIINGNPAIAYYKASTATLKYARATNTSGSTWGTPLTLDATSDVGSYASLQIVSSNPAVAYFDATNYSLKYIRATSIDGSTWGSAVVAATDRSSYISMQIVNNRPTVAYFSEYPNQNLVFKRSSSSTGATWTTAAISFDVNGANPWYISLELINGNPGISYYDATSQTLRYSRSSDVSGTAWSTPLSIEISGGVGQYNSLKSVNGNPGISYYDHSNANLKFVRASDANGTTWGTPVTIDATGDVGKYTSLCIANGNPAIAYYDATNRDLKYVRANDANGTSWGTPLTLDASGFVGEYASMQIVNGAPAISYLDDSNGNLKFIRALDANGTTWAPSVNADAASEHVGSYSTLCVINNYPAISYVDGSLGRNKYVRATDINGNNWGAAQVLFDPSWQVNYTSLKEINARPLVAGQGYLTVIEGLDAFGDTWGTLDTVTNGNYPSMIPIGFGAGIAFSFAGSPAFVLGTNTCGNPTVPTLSATSSTVCAGSPTTLNISSGTLNSATSWQWYTGSCGGTSVGTGTAVVVSPTVTTVYYTRGEGGCVTPNSCNSITVTVNPLPNVTANTTATAVCTGGSVTLTGSGATSYTWTGGATDGTPFAPSSTQTYTVTGTGGNGCTNTATIGVTVNNLPTVGTTAQWGTAACPGNSLMLEGTGATTYTWTGGITDGTPFVVNNPATYTVTGTNGNGCTNTSSIAITTYSVPNVGATATSTLVCAGDPVTLNGTGANTYTWSHSKQNNVVFYPGSTVTYTVTGYSANNCTNTASISVSVLPFPNVGINNSSPIVCGLGNTVTLTGTGASTYTWTNGVTNGAPFAPDSSRTYWVTGTDTNGCTNTAYTNVDIYAPPVVTANSTATVVCNGGNITLTGSGANSNYTWSHGVTDGVPTTISSTTEYTVIGSDWTGCSDTATILVTVGNPTISANASANPICTGSSTTLSGTGASTYTWTGGVSNGVAFSPSSTTSYTVTGTDNNGCTSSGAITVTVVPTPSVNVSGNMTIIQGTTTTLTATGASTYSWSPGTGLSSTTGSSVNANPSVTTVYTVTGSNGVCTASTVFTITVNPGGPTNLQPAYCGVTETSFSQVLYCVAVTNASKYRYELINLSNSSVSTYTRTNSLTNFQMDWLSTTTYNTTYSVRVAALIGGNWTAYGAACNVTTPPVPNTQLQPAYCGIIETSLNQVLYCQPVTGAQYYRYEITDLSNSMVYIYTRTTNLTNFQMDWVSTVAYGKTYSIRVAPQVGGTWFPYSSACTVTTPAAASVTTQLQPAYCGITQTSLNQPLYCNAVSGATQYRYELTDLSNSNVYIYTRTTNLTNFQMDWVSAVGYGKTYSIRVSALATGNWLAYGAACTVTTPPPPANSLQAPYCNIVESSISQVLYCNPVSGATQYRYHLTDLSNSSVYYYTRTNNLTNFQMDWVSGVTAGKTYGVRVTSYVAGGWLPYGPTCNVTTPGSARFDLNPIPDAPGISLSLYPNPNDGQMNIVVNRNSKVFITNLLGETFYEGDLKEGDTEFNFLHMKPGVYVVQVTDGTSATQLRMIKQ